MRVASDLAEQLILKEASNSVAKFEAYACGRGGVSAGVCVSLPVHQSGVRVCGPFFYSVQKNK